MARVREVTGGGAEVVVDTTPYAPQSLNHAVAIAVRKGRIVVAGLKGQRPTLELPADDVIYKELTIRGVLSMSVDDTFRAIEIIESGRYPFERMHTALVPDRAGRGRHPHARGRGPGSESDPPGDRARRSSLTRSARCGRSQPSSGRPRLARAPPPQLEDLEHDDRAGTREEADPQVVRMEERLTRRSRRGRLTQ